MNTVDNKHLKWGIFTTPQSKDDSTFERYVIENHEDLEAFATEFPEVRKIGNVYNNMLSSLVEGRIVVATDRHPLSGFPTYACESKLDPTHPSAINRVKLGELLTEEHRIQFEDNLRSDPDFNYGENELNEWFNDFYV